MVKSQPILRYILRVAPAIAVAVLLSACSSTSTARNMHSETHAVGSGDLSSLQASQDEFETMVRNLDVKSRLMDQYASWKGVRYRLGGSTRKGIDCSAFVQRTFREQFGLELPRSTSEQQETGKSISRTQLRTGDLVLFRAGSTGRHVGQLPWRSWDDAADLRELYVALFRPPRANRGAGDICGLCFPARHDWRSLVQRYCRRLPDRRADWRAVGIDDTAER